jgi:hypothetical protein
MLRQAPGVAGYLKEGVTIRERDRQAKAQSDTQAATPRQRPTKLKRLNCVF